MGIGAQANNPWLLELPDPVTKISWDNYAIFRQRSRRTKFHIDLADRRQADAYEVFLTGMLIKLTWQRQGMTFRAIVIPGTHNEVIGIAVGLWPSERRS
jgi:hypothetical protein